MAPAVRVAAPAEIVSALVLVAAVQAAIVPAVVRVAAARVAAVPAAIAAQVRAVPVAAVAVAVPRAVARSRAAARVHVPRGRKARAVRAAVHAATPRAGRSPTPPASIWTLHLPHGPRPSGRPRRSLLRRPRRKPPSRRSIPGMRRRPPWLRPLAVGAWYAVGLSAVVGVTVAAPATPLPKLAAEAAVAYDVRDAKTGQPIPCKLTLRRRRRHPRSRVHPRRHRPPRVTAPSPPSTASCRSPASAWRACRWAPTTSRSAAVPNGRSATVKRLKLTAKGAAVTAQLNHVVDAHGWLSADFHVHAARSSDSRVPMHDSIFEFVADDVQMITATDHNVVSDYEPYIRELNAGRYITSAIGDELTTNGWGHFGAFPLPRDARASRRGRGAGPRPRARGLLQGRPHARHPARSSTSTTRASTPRSATSTWASSTRATIGPGAPASRGTSTPWR